MIARSAGSRRRLMLAFGAIGYLAQKMDYPLAPLVLALVLGGMMEVSLRQSLKMSHDDVTIFFTRPIAATIMAIVIVIVLWPLLSRLRMKPTLKEAKT
jgi:putative tricarboxylic transport membrane protein